MQRAQGPGLTHASHSVLPTLSLARPRAMRTTEDAAPIINREEYQGNREGGEYIHPRPL
jgi:hypothetical protein